MSDAAPIVASSPSRAWSRNIKPRYSGVQGRSDSAAGAWPLKKARIWSRSRFGSSDCAMREAIPDRCCARSREDAQAREVEAGASSIHDEHRSGQRQQLVAGMGREHKAVEQHHVERAGERQGM